MKNNSVGQGIKGPLHMWGSQRAPRRTLQQRPTQSAGGTFKAETSSKTLSRSLLRVWQSREREGKGKKRSPRDSVASKTWTFALVELGRPRGF